MTHLLLDTSVVIKWFHADGEAELGPARALREAHVRGDLDVHILDLALYEVGNVLSKALRWPSLEVADQLDDVLAIVGDPIACQPSWLREAARMAEAHTLSFSVASWAAAAAGLGVSLVSADRQLLRAGLAESATEVATRLRLAP